MSFFDTIASLAQQQPTADLNPDQQRAVDLASASVNTTIAGQAIGAVSHLQYGVQADDAAQFQAAQLRNNANNAAASSQRQAITQDQQTQLVTSRALAVAAASGGGASDPGVVTQVARLAGEGAYRQAVALYQGQTKADELNLQADATEFQGKETMFNSAMVALGQGVGAVGTAVKGSADAYALDAKQRLSNRPLMAGAKPGIVGRDLASMSGGDTFWSRYGQGGPQGDSGSWSA